MKQIMGVIILVLFIIAHFGNAEALSYERVFDYDVHEYEGDYPYGDCSGTLVQSTNHRTWSTRRLMWWQYEACSSGRTYVTCGGELRCTSTRRRCGRACTLWTNTRGTGTNTVSQANEFVDSVLLQRMPTLVRETSEHLSLPSCYFTVHSTSWRENDLEVEVISGRFRNFRNAVRRRGNCVHSMVAGNVTISCSLSIDGVVAELMTETECGCWYGSRNYIHVDARMCGTTGRLEVTSARNEPAFLRTFVVDNSCFDVTLGGNFFLSSNQRNSLESDIRRYLVTQLQQKFSSYYEEKLEQAFSRMSFSMF
uniref:Putative salivary secreted protein n=1 Tax=Rhipicephalus microplus TaxID=6941 RepID=A0A6M2D088_RHIMP